jgi:hypothetical protein
MQVFWSNRAMLTVIRNILSSICASAWATWKGMKTGTHAEVWLRACVWASQLSLWHVQRSYWFFNIAKFCVDRFNNFTSTCRDSKFGSFHRKDEWPIPQWLVPQRCQVVPNTLITSADRMIRVISRLAWKLPIHGKTPFLGMVIPKLKVKWSYFKKSSGLHRLSHQRSWWGTRLSCGRVYGKRKKSYESQIAILPEILAW